jgi:hypothetical protein
MNRRLAVLAASASGVALATSAASAQVIENFDKFAPTQKYAAWTLPPPYTVITSTATSWEVFSDWTHPNAYGSCYYDIYDSAQGPAINCSSSNSLQLAFNVNSGGAGMLVDLDDGEGDEWQYLFGYGITPGSYVIDVPFNSPSSEPMTASPPTPGGFDFSSITGFNLECDPGTYTSYDVSWLNLSAVTVLTWNNTGASAPADGVTWDTTNNNWNNYYTSATTYSDGDNVVFDDSNNSNYNVTLNTTVAPGMVTVNNSNGKYTISGTGKIADTGPFFKTGSSILTLGVGLTTPSLSITGSTMIIEPNTTVSVGALSITANGVLDITNNQVLINYGSNSDPNLTILGYLATGANAGSWNGTGIISSTAAGNSTYGVGYADGADGVDTNLPSGEIEIAYAQYGDITLSGLVNANDFHILSQNFGKIVTGGWEDGDFLYSGIVNAEDFHLLTENFGQTENGEALSLPASDWAAIDAFAAANGLTVTSSSVPEPQTLGIVVGAGMAMLARRRRRFAAT